MDQKVIVLRRRSYEASERFRLTLDSYVDLGPAQLSNERFYQLAEETLTAIDSYESALTNLLQHLSSSLRYDEVEAEIRRTERTLSVIQDERRSILNAMSQKDRY